VDKIRYSSDCQAAPLYCWSMHSAGVHRTGAERFHNRRFEARTAVRLVVVVNADMLAANSLASGTVYTARIPRGTYEGTTVPHDGGKAYP
jgi:hypothetical protein